MVRVNEKNANRGGETNKHTQVTIAFDDLEVKQINKIMTHYGFKNTSEMMRALIKRANMSIDTGK